MGVRVWRVEGVFCFGFRCRFQSFRVSGLSVGTLKVQGSRLVQTCFWNQGAGFEFTV